MVFTGEESAQLRALARQARVTLSACFHGALALLVRAYTGAADVVFGATVAGRPADLPHAAALVGAFLNTVPVRVRVRSCDPILPWLRLRRLAAARHPPNASRVIASTLGTLPLSMLIATALARFLPLSEPVALAAGYAPPASAAATPCTATSRPVICSCSCTGRSRGRSFSACSIACTSMPSAPATAS